MNDAQTDSNSHLNKNTSTSKESAQTWWSQGVRFECTGSGKCCTSHGEYGYVFLTLEDRQRFAKFFQMRTSDFSRKYCARTKGVWHLRERPNNPDCLFLEKKRCQVYEARPTQCRTWPFWPETMDAKTWKKEVVTFCPGVGKGPVRPASEIRATIEEQQIANQAYVDGN